MRPPFLVRYFGRFHLLIACLFVVPLLVGVAYGEEILWPYLGPAVVLFATGGVLTAIAALGLPPPGAGLRRREGFVVVSVSWMLMVIYGSLPYWLSGSIPDLSGAIFESTSGFTTTGATVLSNIEALPRGLLFWRSFTHWVGGMGIIVLTVAILPELSIGGMQLFAAESSGINIEKLAPRIAQTAKRLWALYVIMTAIEVLLLLPAPGVDLFHAVTHAFSTTATGGFSPLNESIGQIGSLYVEIVVMVFMFLAATNFSLQYRVYMRGDLRRLFTSSEVRLYTAIAIAFTLLVTVDLLVSGVYDDAAESLRYSSFQVLSILTTTGFGTAEFDTWPAFSQFLIVILMTIGGCAGSTAGGLKIIRLVVVLKHAGREFQRLIYPRMVRPITVDGRALDDEILWSILGFFLLYMMSFLAAVLLLSALEHGDPIDLVTATTASLSALNSIGPGLGHVGPLENYGFIHPGGKLALAFCMLLGRLEIYTLLILFVPRFWSTKPSAARGQPTGTRR